MKKEKLKEIQPINLLNPEKMKRREQFRRKKEIILNKRKRSQIDLSQN